MSVYNRFRNELKQNDFCGEIISESKILEKYSTDQSIFYIPPKLVIIPNRKEDISIAVKIVTKLSTSKNPIHLTPRAGGTGLSGGSINNSIIVDMKNLLKLHSIESDGKKLIIDVEPGLYYRSLEKEMQKYNAYIPSFPASKDICTIGGMVANNSAGADSFHYGHTARFVKSLDVIMSDGNTYKIKAISYKELQDILKNNNIMSDTYRYVWNTLEKEIKYISENHPKTHKNSAGYAVWNVLSTDIERFKNGDGSFDMTKIFAGSQGTIGIITRISIYAVIKSTKRSLVAIPVYEIKNLGSIIEDLVSTDNPLNIEINDRSTYFSALKNPFFFAKKYSFFGFVGAMFSMYKLFFVSFRCNVPRFMLLITTDEMYSNTPEKIIHRMSSRFKLSPWLVTNKSQYDILWAIRASSYTLSKLAKKDKRPAAFLEDMVVPPKRLSEFLIDIEKLFLKYNISAYMHGHGGDGHFHFYPLLDFTQQDTPKKITTMAKDFFKTAIKYGGNICGEHNDGIIRTPYLNMIFSKKMLVIFEQLEHTADPLQIFNPGKKVKPIFDIEKIIRTTNK